MNRNDQFNDILNTCLDRLFKGETIERCLQDYPEQARELEPLLRTADAARVASTIQPQAEFKAKARYEFQAAVHEMVAKKRNKFSFNWLPQWRWQSGWAIALIAFLVVVIGGGGTIAAASYSMPDSALYSFKLVTERVQLAVASSDISKAELNARFANRRTEEIGYMASKGNPQEVQIIAARLNTNLSNMTQITVKNNSRNNAALNHGAGGGVNTLATPGPETNGAGQNDTPQPMFGAATAPSVPTVAPVLPPAAATFAPDNTAKGATPAPTALLIVPTPVVTMPPVTVNAPAPAANGTFSAQTATSSNAASNNQTRLTAEGEKLKKIMEDNYNERQSKLQATLDTAPADMRPAIRQAIAQSQSEYDQEISNIYSGESTN
ncbi:MAG TPA: DUF5667 domain-containing protein [Dehalococcoidales bacterium]